MIGLHSTKLKKDYSEILETNALQPVNLIASEVLQPVVNISPIIDFFKVANFDADTIKSTYITGITMACYADSGTTNGEAEIIFKPEYQPIITLTIKTDVTTSAGTNSIHIPFPFRGLKLEKGSSVTINTTQGFVFVQGYQSSDRG